MSTKTTTTDLQKEVEYLTRELNAERSKTRQFSVVLGQLRYRVTEVLDLDQQTRSTLLEEIDTVFRRAL